MAFTPALRTALPTHFRRAKKLGMGGLGNGRSDEPEPLGEARPRALKEQHLAAAPFGAWQVLPLSKLRERLARVWPVSLKQLPMLTHGFGLSTGLVRPVHCSGRVLREPVKLTRR